MDEINQALQAIQPELKAGTEIAGLGSSAYNMYNQYQNQQYQNQLRSVAQDPAKMNAYAAQFTQPLTAGLQKGVANEAQADLATRGLTDSPEISQQVYAQAIAPSTQQNLQLGYQNALQALQVGGGAVNPAYQQMLNQSQLAKIFAGQPGGGQAPGTPPTLQDYLRTMGTQSPQINQSQWNPGVAPGSTNWDLGSGTPDMSMFPSSTPDAAYTPDYISSTGGGNYEGDMGLGS